VSDPDAADRFGGAANAARDTHYDQHMRRVLCVALIAACSSKKATPPDPPPAHKPEQPLRDAIGDSDLRALVYDWLSVQACKRMSNHFSGIKDRTRKDVVNGQVWIRDCKITNDGKQLIADVTGAGWQWQNKVEKKAGGTFEVNQYVKFEVAAKLYGTADLAYSRKDHVASVWFSPTAKAEVKLTPIGDIKVNNDDAWSSVIGGAATLIGESPEDKAEDTADTKGTDAFEEQAARGFEVAMDLCTNTTRMALKRLPKGQLPKPNVGETHNIKVEVQNYGVIMYGPYVARDGLTLDVDVTGGSLKLNLACQKEAEETAQNFLDNKPNTAKPIAAELVTGHAKLKLPRERCPVVLVARSVQPQPVMLSFVRPKPEATRAAGGPLAACASTADAVSDQMRAEHKAERAKAGSGSGSGSGSAK
jgi:hypothetical protein